MPINPLTGEKASTTDPSTWGTMESAVRRMDADNLAGVGFVFTKEDPYCGVDLDKCRDPLTGVLESWAQKIVDELQSYTELSPSGTGVHAIARASLPEGGRKKGQVEMYDTGRYFTVTGSRLDGTPPTVEDRTTEVRAVHSRVFGHRGKARIKTKNESGDGNARPAPTPDKEVIARARASKRGQKFSALFDEGDWLGQGYPSQSEADLAMCSFLARQRADAKTIDRVFRLSKLYRSKWDERHHADGTTYGEGTIAKALGDNDADDPFEPYHPNNAGLRMVRQHGDDLLFCVGKWSCYDGKRWLVDNGHRVARVSREVVDSYRDEHTRLTQHIQSLEADRKSCKDPQAIDKLEAEIGRIQSRADNCWRFYMGMSRPRGISEVAEAASWDLTCELAELDADPHLLNVQNGTLDLRTGRLLPHRRSDLITKITPGAFVPEAKSVLWKEFLDHAMGDDHATRSYLQRALGSSLIGVQDEDLIIMLIGPGGTGKSTLLEACRCAIGDYGKTVPFDVFLERKHSGGTTPELASLPGVRMVTSAEPKEGVAFDLARLKMLTGGDTIMVNPKYKPAFEYAPVFTLVLATNTAPKANASDSAMWRRLKIICFENRVEKKNKDLRLQLAGRLRGRDADPTHQAAVLAWLVAGCREYLAGGLGEPPEGVVTSTESTRKEMDPLWAFLQDECELDPSATTQSSDLRQAYEAYAARRGVGAVDDATWGLMLTTRGAASVRRSVEGKTHRFWKGIRLRDTDPDTGRDDAASGENQPGSAQEGEYAGS